MNREEFLIYVHTEESERHTYAHFVQQSYWTCGRFCMEGKKVLKRTRFSVSMYLKLTHRHGKCSRSNKLLRYSTAQHSAHFTSWSANKHETLYVFLTPLLLVLAPSHSLYFESKKCYFSSLLFIQQQIFRCSKWRDPTRSVHSISKAKYFAKRMI